MRGPDSAHTLWNGPKTWSESEEMLLTSSAATAALAAAVLLLRRGAGPAVLAGHAAATRAATAPNYVLYDLDLATLILNGYKEAN